MSVTSVICPTCGFEVTHVSVGRKGSIKLDVVEWVSLCEASNKAQPGNCPNLNAAMEIAGLPPFQD